MNLSRSVKFGVLGTLAVIVAAVLVAIGPQPQPLAYHGFADDRSWWGITNTLDVLSNLAFLFAALYGLHVTKQISGTPSRYHHPWEIKCMTVLFVGVVLIAVGSSYYHLAPDNDRLVWDRLPMTVAFMSLFALVISERISQTAGRRLLLPLLIVGGLSVVYWHQTELAGAGDLRPYIFVQLYPLAAIPFILWLFPASYTRGADLMVGLLWYVLAKGFELGDAWFYDNTTIVSGHSLKHIAAGVGIFWIARMIAKRQIVSSTN